MELNSKIKSLTSFVALVHILFSMTCVCASADSASRRGDVFFFRTDGTGLTKISGESTRELIPAVQDHLKKLKDVIKQLEAQPLKLMPGEFSSLATAQSADIMTYIIGEYRWRHGFGYPALQLSLKNGGRLRLMVYVTDTIHHQAGGTTPGMHEVQTMIRDALSETFNLNKSVHQLVSGYHYRPYLTKSPDELYKEILIPGRYQKIAVLPQTGTQTPAHMFKTTFARKAGLSLALLKAQKFETFSDTRAITPVLFNAQYTYPYRPASSISQPVLGRYLHENEGSKFKQNRDSVVIFHAKETPVSEAQKVILQREAVNIAGSTAGSKDMSRVSYMNSFSESPQNAPLPVGIYAQSSFQDGNELKEFGTLHVPGLAFDDPVQVHFKKYVDKNGGINKADLTRVRKEYRIIAGMVIQGYICHARLGHSNGRMLIGSYGANNFVNALNPQAQADVRLVIAETLVGALAEHAEKLKHYGVRDVRVGILLTGHFLTPPDTARLQKKLLFAGLKNLGPWLYIPDDSLPGDFNVNAWDPNSNIGNGNGEDNSLDGYHGRSTTAGFDIHTSPNLFDIIRYQKVIH